MIRGEPLLRRFRALSRLCIEIGNQHVRCVRTFSVTDAINALRPFYLAVHPDFFGQHPREREMNENSLKKLNNHLQCLQHPGHRAPQPTKLTFYVRETAGNAGAAQGMNTPGFRAVSFTLQTQDLLGTVVNILKSCCLSIDHIQDSKAAVDSPHQNGSISFSRPIKWDKTYYTFTGYRDPEEELDSSRQLEPILGWRKSWGIAHRCSQLHSLSRFAQQNSAILHNIKGCTLIFAEHSGMNAAGQIMLGTVDVHQHWTKILERLPTYYDLHSQLCMLEERISFLLGDVELIYNEDLQPSMMLEDYYRMLKTFHQSLVVSRPLFHPRSLKGLQMILEKGSSAPTLLKTGQLRVPITCDPSALQWFILSHTQTARTYLRKEEELKIQQEKLIKVCIEQFFLKRLYKEQSVSSEQMVESCKRLLEEPTELPRMHLCISHFYSVLQDGDLCIPWDWKQ
ncbi:T-cell activation inhibitor, mitochondrial isoform X3 [Leucoraja erinacea]|uniref:T-cell activation inhibitor, mitochondrial isoform X3 n=1 Tax=Leucoraja erinaceus TaxID=7782 RepID=UPI002453A9C7|nr:T-cell activation inhibitor, mitochondrial isoform X3 [Leucoraja erinacea]